MNLYPYQQDGAEFLAGRSRAYLADDCGLGKSAQACRAAVLSESTNVMVVAPASAIPGWKREWEQWGQPGVKFEVISYDKLVRTKNLTARHKYETVILDEAHYVKSRMAQRTLAALELARSARQAWLLSATPMPNHPGELWAPLRALFPEIAAHFHIRTYREWLDMFCLWQNTIYGPKVWGSKNLNLLRDRLHSIMLRRMLKDVSLQLPPLRVDVQLMVEKDMDSAIKRAGLNGEGLRDMIEREEQSDSGSLSRLRRVLGTMKAPLIAEIVSEELKNQQYDKIVILAHHRDTINMLHQQLAQFGVVTLTGDDSPQKRGEAVDAFTRDPNVRVFLGQQMAAGVALNLQIAHELVLVEPSWSPGDNIQAVQRIRRIGSTLPCRARIFAAADSLDQAIMEVIARKTRMQTFLGLQGET